MIKKVALILTLMLVGLLAVASVSAADNLTCDDVGIEDISDEVITEKTHNVSNVDDILATSVGSSISDYEDNDNISSSNEEDDSLSLSLGEDDVLGSSSPSTAYNVNVSDVTMYYGANKTIWMSINSAIGDSYATYDFYFKVYDSNNNLKINTRYHGKTIAQTLQYKFKNPSLETGVYTIKIVNSYDNQVMDSATLIVKSVPYSAYSVKVNDSTIEYWSNESIFMSISPALGYTYKYDFYLRIYDSNNNLKINMRYYSTGSFYNKTYSLSATTLNPGVYTIKIVNTNDGYVMDNATLTVRSVPYSAYSVRVSDTSMDYGYYGSILISISPALSYVCKYDFYLKIYDSNNVEKISKRYSSTSSAYSQTYSINPRMLNPGMYTIKIENVYDNQIMATAKLNVNILSHSDYSVNVDDTVIDFESAGEVKLSIVPDNSNKYDFYLKVFDSNNIEKISKLYRSYNPTTSINHAIKANELDPGFYTIKIVNFADNYVMDTAMLTVRSLPYSAYSVNVSDTYIDYESGGKISMSISPASRYSHKFDFYLKVYDSDNVEKISSRFNGTWNFISAYYTMGAKELTPGMYTIKLLNFDDNYVMDSAELTIGPVYVVNKYKNVKINSPNVYYKQNKEITYSFEGNLKGCFNIYKGNTLICSKEFNTNVQITDIFKYNKHSYSYAINKINDVGKYAVKITDSYGNVIAQSTFEITKAPTMSISQDFSTKKGSKETIYLFVYDNDWNGKGINGDAKFKIGSKTYNVKVKNGFAQIKVKFPSKLKTYKCSAQFLGNEHYKSSSEKFTIRVENDKSYVDVDSFTATSGKKYTIKAKVTSCFDGKNVKSGTVNFKINGKTYKANIKNGIAKITITAPNKAKKYTCKATHLGDKKIRGSSTKFTITVIKKKITKFTVVVPTKLNKKISKSHGKYSIMTYKWKDEEGPHLRIYVLKNGKRFLGFSAKYYCHYSFGGGKWIITKTNNYEQKTVPDNYPWKSFYANNILSIDKVKVTIWVKS